MKIGELARLTEVSPSTLRYYESIGLLPTARRKGGQRIYDEGVLERLRFIRTAKTRTFGLEEFAHFLSGQEADWRPFAEAKVLELENVIETYQEMKGMLSGRVAETISDLTQKPSGLPATKFSLPSDQRNISR